MNKLLEKYNDEIQAVFKKYPPDQKRSAVMPLLYMAQREAGYVDNHAMDDIAEILDISRTEVAAIIGKDQVVSRLKKAIQFIEARPQ